MGSRPTLEGRLGADLSQGVAARRRDRPGVAEPDQSGPRRPASSAIRHSSPMPVSAGAHRTACWRGASHASKQPYLALPWRRVSRRGERE